MPGGAFTIVECGALGAFAVIAGSAFLFTSYASKDIPPLTLTCLRLSIGSLGLFVLSFFTGKMAGLKTASRFEIASLAGIGLVNTAIPYTMFAAALSQGVSVVTAAVLSGASPLFATVLSMIIFDDASRMWLQPKKLFGLATGFAGVVIIAFIKQLVKDTQTTSTVIGITLQLVGVLSKAVAAVLAERHNGKYQTGMPVFVQAFLQAAAGAFIALPLALALDCTHLTPRFLDPHRVTQSGGFCGFASRADQQALVGVMYLALCSSCIVYILQFYLLKNVGAVRQMLVDYLTPAVGIIEGAIFKGELNNVTVEEQILFGVGVALIVVGLVLLQVSQKASSACDVVEPLTSVSPPADRRDTA